MLRTVTSKDCKIYSVNTCNTVPSLFIYTKRETKTTYKTHQINNSLFTSCFM